MTNNWEFPEESQALAEIYLSGSDTAEETSSGYVVKEILRTGEWPVIPTKGGVVKKPLRIVRDGKSDKHEGVISLSEVVENFQAKAIANPQIPLSDDEKEDHKNLTRLNTGFVRDVYIVDDENGSKLVAKMEFTEPEVKERVLRGTYADVSCGIPWEVVSRGNRYGSTLEHVAITNRPFIDGLGPFLAASDISEDTEIVHFGDITEVTDLLSKPPAELEPDAGDLGGLPGNFEEVVKEQANLKLTKQLALSNFSANNVRTELYVTDSSSNSSWWVPFSVTNGGNGNFHIILGNSESWTKAEEAEENNEGNPSDAPADQVETPPVVPAAPLRSDPNKDSELEVAQRLREIRFSSQTVTTTTTEEDMPLSREELDRLELSDEARAAFQQILDDNAQLSAKTREAEADRRVEELKELGLSEKPGFLKLYRQIHLSDDGGPAAVLLSDEGEKEERVTAKDILDRAIEALKGADGKVVLSDQALVTGDDDKPPVDASAEVELSERVKVAREALGMK